MERKKAKVWGRQSRIHESRHSQVDANKQGNDSAFKRSESDEDLDVSTDPNLTACHAPDNRKKEKKGGRPRGHRVGCTIGRGGQLSVCTLDNGV